MQIVKASIKNTSADDTEPIFTVTSQTSSKTRERSTSINPIPDFTIGFASPDCQSSNIGRIYEKIMNKNFKHFTKSSLKY